MNCLSEALALAAQIFHMNQQFQHQRLSHCTLWKFRLPSSHLCSKCVQQMRSKSLQSRAPQETAAGNIPRGGQRQLPDSEAAAWFLRIDSAVMMGLGAGRQRPALLHLPPSPGAPRGCSLKFCNPPQCRASLWTTARPPLQCSVDCRRQVPPVSAAVIELCFCPGI